jgi:prevent-host-death family protein
MTNSKLATKPKPTVANVAEAKAHLSDLIARAVHRGERIFIARRGRPVVALISVEELAELERNEGNGQDLLDALRALHEDPEHSAMLEEYANMLDEIVRDRQKEMGHPPITFEDE